MDNVPFDMAFSSAIPKISAALLESSSRETAVSAKNNRSLNEVKFSKTKVTYMF